MFKRKLLLADDSVTIQKVINLTFADEGIEVFTVGSGTAAIERLDEVKPDLVLADVHMPGLTGYQVCEQIRQHEQFKNIPVMLLVGSFEPFDEAEARRAGANDYLTKPFQSIRQLVQKVNSLLSSESPADASTENMAATAETIQRNEPAVVIEPAAAVFDQEPMSRAASSSATGSANDFDNFAINDVVDDETIETISGGSFDNNRGNATVFDSFDPNVATDSPFNTADAAPHFAETTFELVSAETDFPSTETRELENSAYISAAEVDYGESTAANNDSFETTVYEIQAESPSVTDESTSFAALGEVLPSEEIEQSEVTFEIVPDNQSEIIVSAEAPHYEANGKQDYYESSSSTPLKFPATTVSQNAADDEMSVLEIDLSDDGLVEPNDQDSVLDLQTDLLMINEFEEELAVETELSATDSLASQADRRFAQTDRQVAMEFPPEIIDAIAQKVLEKLSDEVIERIVLKNMPEKLEAIMQKYLANSER